MKLKDRLKDIYTAHAAQAPSADGVVARVRGKAARTSRVRGRWITLPAAAAAVIAVVAGTAVAGNRARQPDMAGSSPAPRNVASLNCPATFQANPDSRRHVGEPELTNDPHDAPLGLVVHDPALALACRVDNWAMGGSATVSGQDLTKLVATLRSLPTQIPRPTGTTRLVCTAMGIPPSGYLIRFADDAGRTWDVWARDGDGCGPSITNGSITRYETDSELQQLVELFKIH
jgi:hypothetical protein